MSVLISLKRLKDENVFFILFHVFQLYLGIDAVSMISLWSLIIQRTYITPILVCGEKIEDA